MCAREGSNDGRHPEISVPVVGCGGWEIVGMDRKRGVHKCVRLGTDGCGHVHRFSSRPRIYSEVMFFRVPQQLPQHRRSLCQSRCRRRNIFTEHVRISEKQISHADRGISVKFFKIKVKYPFRVVWSPRTVWQPYSGVGSCCSCNRPHLRIILHIRCQC